MIASELIIAFRNQLDNQRTLIICFKTGLIIARTAAAPIIGPSDPPRHLKSGGSNAGRYAGAPGEFDQMDSMRNINLKGARRRCG
jgi:hypothetical protein